MARRSIDRETLAEAIAHAQVTGDWLGAGEQRGISKSTMYRERARIRKEERAAGQPAKLVAKPSTKRKPAPKAPISAPGDGVKLPDDLDGLVGAAKDFAALDDIVEMLTDMLGTMKPGDSGLATLTTALINAIAKRAKMRPPPPPDPTAQLAEARRLDAATRKKMLRYVEEHEAAARRNGVCLHCDSKLSAEKLRELYGERR